jgi:hypothetical protein
MNGRFGANDRFTGGEPLADVSAEGIRAAVRHGPEGVDEDRAEKSIETGDSEVESEVPAQEWPTAHARSTPGRRERRSRRRL